MYAIVLHHTIQITHYLFIIVIKLELFKDE